jgi:predicted ArsR family transcriptional regulator
MGALDRATLPSGTKREILDLLIREELGAQTLAERLGVSPAAVRQHLATLQGAGLVERGRGEPQPGRPTYVYRLSPVARAAYPKRYDVLASELVDVLVDRHGESPALEIVAAAARRVAGRARAAVTTGDVERRWDLLLAWLEETFALEAGWETTGDGGRRIVVHHCPFQDIAADRPKVCGTFVTTLIGELLGGVDVNHEAADDPVRCCTLEVKEWDARRAGS